MVEFVVRSAEAVVALTGARLAADATCGPAAPMVRLLEFGLGLCVVLGVLTLVTLTIGNAFVMALLGEEGKERLEPAASDAPRSTRLERATRW